MEGIANKGERHFTTGNFVSHARFLSPDIYGPVVRDNVVRACIDCLVLNPIGLIVLGKRRIEPWPDWWTFGGRIIPGDSPEESCARTIQRDLGIKVASDRFFFLDFLSNAFAKRQEPPQENGCHDINLFHGIFLGLDETAAIKCERGEYSETGWFSKKNILKGSFHPAIQKIIEIARAKGLI